MAYKYEMTNDHRKLLEHMMGWYWNVGKQQNHKTDKPKQLDV